jgi:hypothetical protein
MDVGGKLSSCAAESYCGRFPPLVNFFDQYIFNRLCLKYLLRLRLRLRVGLFSLARTSCVRGLDIKTISKYCVIRTLKHSECHRKVSRQACTEMVCSAHGHGHGHGHAMFICSTRELPSDSTANHRLRHPNYTD